MSDVDARLAAAESEEARLGILREEIADREDRLTELREEHDALKSERDRVKRTFAEALAPHTAFDVEELTERFTLDELREKCDALDTASTTSLAEVEPAVLSGGGERQVATLSPADRERVAELEARLDALPDRDDGLAAQERALVEEELADLRGEPP